MRVLLEDKNKVVDVPDGLQPDQMEAELRKFYSPEELHGSTTFSEREGYRIRKGRSVVDDGKNWYEAMTGGITLDIASQRSKELNVEFTPENDEKHQAYNWPERFAGATTELAPYMLDSAIQGAVYGEGMGVAAAGAAALAGQAGPQIALPEEIITVPGAYIAGRSVGQAYGTWMNASKVEGGQLFKSLIQDGVEPKTARTFAVPAGYMIGALELLQVERLLPGFGREGIKKTLKTALKNGESKTAKTLAKFSGRLSKNLAETTAIETAQELAQEIVGITAEVGASIYEDMAAEEGYTGPDSDEIKLRLQDTITSSLLGFPLLGLPRSIHSTASLHGREMFANRFMTKQAEKQREALTPFIEEAAGHDNFNDFHQSLGEEIDDKFANTLGFDNRVLMEEAAWNESRKLQGEHIYEENARMQEDAGLSIDPVREGYKSVAKSISRIAEPISSRLNQINPKLKNKLRRYEFDLKQRVLQDEKSVKPFLQAYKKLSDRDKVDLDLALKNGDIAKIDDVVNRNGITKEFQAVRSMLESAHKRATDTGLKIGHIENYFPRQVEDLKGLMAFFQKQDVWPEMHKAIKEKEEKLGRKMTDEEKAEFLNTMLKGFKGNGKPGSMKKREVSVVTPQINEFYHESPQALMNYVYKVNDFVEARRFFGNSVKGSDMSEKTLEESIGNFVLDMLQSGDIKGTEAQDVSEIMSARFSPKAPGRAVSTIKNISYIETMGSITSAITQIGDIAFALYKSGFYRTGKALAKTLTGQSDVTKEDIGIEFIAEEFASKSKSQAALKAVFKIVGLNWMDRLGKEALINAAFDRFSKLATETEQKNPDSLTGAHKKLRDQLEEIFGEEAYQTFEDLKNKKASDNVKYLLFSELADVQPIALSEMPEAYLKSGNMRILYMLKTYTIKQIDVFRNEVFIDMHKRPVEALQNFIRLSALLIMANATADVLKDLLLGRPMDSDEDDYLWIKLTDNILRLFGLSKYSLYRFKKDGVADGISSIVLPPIFNFVTRGAKDIDKAMKDDGDFEPQQAEIIQSVPLLGKLYYWWFGGGRKKIEDDE